MKRYSVPCWNCEEGFVEPCDEWGSDQCCVCYGKGHLIVTELTDDNCEEAVEIKEPLSSDNREAK